MKPRFSSISSSQTQSQPSISLSKSPKNYINSLPNPNFFLSQQHNFSISPLYNTRRNSYNLFIIIIYFFVYIHRDFCMESQRVYVKWREVFVLSERGRKEVRYYLKRRDGVSDLVVVGKERRDLKVYRYNIRETSLVGQADFKLKSRKDVIEWLNSVISGDFYGHSSFFCVFWVKIGSLQFLAGLSGVWFV